MHEESLVPGRLLDSEEWREGQASWARRLVEREASQASTALAGREFEFARGVPPGLVARFTHQMLLRFTRGGHVHAVESFDHFAFCKRGLYAEREGLALLVQPTDDGKRVLVLAQERDGAVGSAALLQLLREVLPLTRLLSGLLRGDADAGEPTMWPGARAVEWALAPVGLLEHKVQVRTARQALQRGERTIKCTRGSVRLAARAASVRAELAQLVLDDEGVATAPALYALQYPRGRVRLAGERRVVETPFW